MLLQTACMSVGLGTACTLYEPAIVLEALCLTAAIVVGLTLYTFYAVRKGVSFQRLGPILFCGAPQNRTQRGSCTEISWACSTVRAEGTSLGPHALHCRFVSCNPSRHASGPACILCCSPMAAMNPACICMLAVRREVQLKTQMAVQRLASATLPSPTVHKK